MEMMKKEKEKRRRGKKGGGGLKELSFPPYTGSHTCESRGESDEFMCGGGGGEEEREERAQKRE